MHPYQKPQLKLPGTLVVPMGHQKGTFKLELLWQNSRGSAFECSEPALVLNPYETPVITAANILSHIHGPNAAIPKKFEDQQTAFKKIFEHIQTFCGSHDPRIKSFMDSYQENALTSYWTPGEPEPHLFSTPMPLPLLNIYYTMGRDIQVLVPEISFWNGSHFCCLRFYGDTNTVPAWDIMCHQELRGFGFHIEPVFGECLHLGSTLTINFGLAGHEYSPSENPLSKQSAPF
jgi:hypothetical protein